ncbi:MAG TPA: hypothetical protein VKX25_00535 [Bryobacteraceae bacterium]|nr:hypothetical protein [Bryobacteraceae bacterium]
MFKGELGTGEVRSFKGDQDKNSICGTEQKLDFLSLMRKHKLPLLYQWASA